MVVLVVLELLELRVIKGSEATRDLLGRQVNKEGKEIWVLLDCLVTL